MRLTSFEKEAIINTFRDHFSENDHLWLFGSRVDDTKKGGDIDLYIQSTELSADKVYKAKINFLVALTSKIGDQKIDVVISLPNHKLAIYQHAKETGVRLV